MIVFTLSFYNQHREYVRKYAKRAKDRLKKDFYDIFEPFEKVHFVIVSV